MKQFCYNLLQVIKQFCTKRTIEPIKLTKRPYQQDQSYNQQYQQSYYQQDYGQQQFQQQQYDYSAADAQQNSNIISIKTEDIDEYDLDPIPEGLLRISICLDCIGVFKLFLYT